MNKLFFILIAVIAICLIIIYPESPQSQLIPNPTPIPKPATPTSIANKHVPSEKLKATPTIRKITKTPPITWKEHINTKLKFKTIVPTNLFINGNEYYFEHLETLEHPEYNESFAYLNFNTDLNFNSFYRQVYNNQVKDEPYDKQYYSHLDHQLNSIIPNTVRTDYYQHLLCAGYEYECRQQGTTTINGKKYSIGKLAGSVYHHKDYPTMIINDINVDVTTNFMTYTTMMSVMTDDLAKPYYDYFDKIISNISPIQ